MPDQLTPTDRTKVRRLPDRGTYDRDVIDAVIDEAYIAHVGLRGRRRAPRAADDLRARRRPPLPPRRGRQRHAAGARPAREVCVTITLLDGLVLARSAFHHSMNYRSVVLLGQPTQGGGRGGEAAAPSTCIVEHVLRGRSTVARPTNDSELRKTLVLDLAIAEGSAKVRTGGPIDDDEDMDLPVWAGVVPLRLVPGAPEQDAAQPTDLPPPAVVGEIGREA